MNCGTFLAGFSVTVAFLFMSVCLCAVCHAEEELPSVSETLIRTGQYHENSDEPDTEHAAEENNTVSGNTDISFQSVNEFLLRQQQEQLIKTREQEQKKQERKERLQRKKEERRKAREIQAAEMNASGKSVKEEDKSSHTGLAGNVRELVITPDDFYAGNYTGKDYIGKYFIFDLEPGAVSELLPGIMNIMEKILTGKSIGKSGAGINGNKICSVCTQHRDGWNNQAHTGFIDWKIVLMRLKPGCSLPSPKQGLLAVWIAPPDLPFVHIEEYDCNKKVPVSENMCTGWIQYYICD